MSTRCIIIKLSSICKESHGSRGTTLKRGDIKEDLLWKMLMKKRKNLNPRNLLSQLKLNKSLSIPKEILKKHATIMTILLKSHKSNIGSLTRVVDLFFKTKMRNHLSLLKDNRLLQIPSHWQRNEFSEIYLYLYLVFFNFNKIDNWYLNISILC